MTKRIIKPPAAEKDPVTGPITYPASFERRKGEGPNSARLRYEIEWRAGQHQNPKPDAFPGRARPGKGGGTFLRNGNFITRSGRHITGPLCKVCGGLADNTHCLACGVAQ